MPRTLPRSLPRYRAAIGHAENPPHRECRVRNCAGPTTRPRGAFRTIALPGAPREERSGTALPAQMEAAGPPRRPRRPGLRSTRIRDRDRTRNRLHHWRIATPDINDSEASPQGGRLQGHGHASNHWRVIYDPRPNRPGRKLDSVFRNAGEQNSNDPLQISAGGESPR